MAATTGAAVSYLSNLITYRGDPVKAWELYWQTSPWAIMTFATTYALAFLADDEPMEGYGGVLTSSRLRWVEGVALTLVMVTAAWLVHELLLGAHETALEMSLSKPGMQVRRVRSLREIEMLTVIIGFAMGSLVPSWYRAAPAEPASTPLAPQMTKLQPEHEPGLGG